jgi:hypothetical protein
MIKIRLNRLIGAFALCLIFIKIYQHNQIIKLNYEKQRLELRQNDLKKLCSDLKIEFCQLKDVNHVKIAAKEKFGLEKLKFSQIVTFTGF